MKSPRPAKRSQYSARCFKRQCHSRSTADRIIAPVKKRICARSVFSESRPWVTSSRIFRLAGLLKYYSRTPTWPPRARANNAAPTTSPTMITATTVAFSNSAPAAKSSMSKDSVRDFPDPSKTTVLNRAADNPTRPTCSGRHGPRQNHPTKVCSHVRRNFEALAVACPMYQTLVIISCRGHAFDPWRSQKINRGRRSA